MSGMSLWFALLGAEVVLVLLGVLSFSWLRSFQEKRLDRKAMRALVAKVKRRKGERAAAIRKLLSQRFKLSDNLLETSTTAMLREELYLYQQFANLYAKRDAGAAVNFDLTFEAALAPYWSLPEQEVDIADDPVESAGADTEEFNRLIRENQELRDELRVTMDTITLMFDEYTSMFRGGHVQTDPALGEGGGLTAETQPTSDSTANDVTVDGIIESTQGSARSGESVSAEATQPMDGSDQLPEEIEVGFESGLDTESSRRPAGAALDIAPTDSLQSTVTKSEQGGGLSTDGAAVAPVVSDADADALLADALGGADLAIDELEDLFDEDGIDDLEDAKVKAVPGDLDDARSVAI